MRYKDHKMGYLLERLMEEGVLRSMSKKGARTDLQRWITLGWIKFRMKPPGMHYVVNDKEIEQIIKDFSPGGDGSWEPGKKYPVNKPQVAEEEGPDTEVTGNRSPSAVFDDDPDNGGFSLSSVKSQGSLIF